MTNKNAKQSEILGHISSSLAYVKEQLNAKNTDPEVRKGINSMCDNFRYYEREQVDLETLEYFVQYHNDLSRKLAKEYNPKTVLTSDKKLVKQNKGKLIVVGRIAQIFKENK